MRLTTSDIGFAIRDFLEDHNIVHMSDKGEHRGDDTVEFIDISDASNPVIHMLNGQCFRIRITVEG